MIKFRGKAIGDRNAEAGEIVYGDYCRGLSKANPSIRCWSKCCYVDVAEESVGQYAGQVGNGELYDGDEIRIDMDKAAQIVGEGLMLSTLKNSKPTAEAKLYVEYSHYRYRLIWRTPNGRVDTGLDLALISNILECVEVVR